MYRKKSVGHCELFFGSHILDFAFFNLLPRLFAQSLRFTLRRCCVGLGIGGACIIVLTAT